MDHQKRSAKRSSRLDENSGRRIRGIKYDQNKPRWSLMPWAELEDVARVMTAGAEKYADSNWQLVPRGKDRYFSAAMRHLVAWKNGERFDPETGITHLGHAICCILFLMWYDSQKKN